MTKLTKRIYLSVAIFVIGISSFILYGLYLMEIEDRYGDLQQIYFDSKSDDVIVNNLNGKLGLIELKNRRIFVNNSREIFDLNEWLDPQNKLIFNIDIYRPKTNPSSYINLNRKEFDKKIENEELKPISHLEVKY